MGNDQPWERDAPDIRPVPNVQTPAGGHRPPLQPETDFCHGLPGTALPHHLQPRDVEAFIAGVSDQKTLRLHLVALVGIDFETGSKAVGG